MASVTTFPKLHSLSIQSGFLASRKTKLEPTLTCKALGFVAVASLASVTGSVSVVTMGTFHSTKITDIAIQKFSRANGTEDFGLQEFSLGKRRQPRVRFVFKH